jgi:hypothetical protein
VPNVENIRKWVDALRSGKYKQGTGFLKRVVDGETCHCCLGVACEVSGLVPEWADCTSMHTESGALAPAFDTGTSFLPMAVAEWLGFDSPIDDNSNPTIGTEVDEDEVEWDIDAVDANDVNGWSFDQIADALEKTYLL